MRTILSLSLLLLGTSSFAQSFQQEAHTERKTLSRSLDEVYQVFPSDKRAKVGPYKVIDDQKHVLVIGIYKNGVKDSLWTYFNTWAEPIQQYDFRNRKMIYVGLDSATIVHARYTLDTPPADSDDILPPYKIGGVNYGFYLLFDARDIPQEVKAGPDGASMSFLFDIDDKGQLKGWKIVFHGKQFNDIVQTKSIKGLPSDAYEFTPAMVNNHPVGSHLTLWVPLDVEHVEARGTNNIVTQH
jgi:hypothetical protein